MEDLRKRLFRIEDRIKYLVQIKEGNERGNLSGIKEKYHHLTNFYYDFSQDDIGREILDIEESLAFLEELYQENLTSMERVRIVRSPLRFSLKDILENVYEDYTELGGEDEANIDPSMVAAKANILRKVKDKTFTRQVMVIGQEKGHGEEYRNGGSVKPWGNEKALRFMLVAQTEGIPIHFYIFTPGSFPVEEYPGAAQQIARNLYVLSKLRVPTVSVISEGGSGGAEAIGLTDIRLMFSHGYYSVISPEGAAAIEGKIREGKKAPGELIEVCAQRLRITPEDNLELGTIDRIIKEPRLGARRDDFSFFRRLRFEVIRATDEVVLGAKRKSLRAFRAHAVKINKAKGADLDHHVDISWDLNHDEIKRLVRLRAKKYRNMASEAYGGKPSALTAFCRKTINRIARVFYGFHFDLIKRQKQVEQVCKDVSGEGSMLWKRIISPFHSAYNFISKKSKEKTIKFATTAELPVPGSKIVYGDTYTSPRANEDKTITCPNAAKNGCKDLWLPDLYGEFCGVCENCGHHFPMEYEWYLKHIFDCHTIREFNAKISSQNPLSYEGLNDRLKAAANKTGRKSGIITFFADLMGVNLVVAILYNDFRNGTVGAAEGEKFALACEVAKLQRKPLLFYVHTTAGIRIQEGTIGVVQMPKCTLSVREYIDSGGLYIVVYDNNSYAGPVASFLGCSPYQFAIRSSRIGFAGQRVIKETTGQDIPPDYHSARNALKRGHIQGIWDRRELRGNLYRSLLTMGGRNLYYR